MHVVPGFVQGYSITEIVRNATKSNLALSSAGFVSLYM
jgi:hypothetical protein